MPRKTIADSRRLAVVGLSGASVEWLEHDRDGKVLYARVPLEGDGPEDYARTIVVARERAGGTQSSVVLSVGGGLAKHRLIELPTVSKRELAKILSRKAAGLIGESEDPPLFSCIEHKTGGRDEPSQWSLVAMCREQMCGIVYGLRRAGIKVARIASEELAALDRAMGMAAEPNMGMICIAVGVSSTQVSLICDDKLYMVETLDGNPSETPQLVASLLQSIKTTAGFWRRTQRGSLVRAVVTLGVGPERGELLGNAIQVALPGAGASCYPNRNDLPTEGLPSELEGCLDRITSLEACLTNGPFSPPLSFPLAPRNVTLVAALMAALVVGSGTFGLVQGSAGAKTTALQQEIAANQRISVALRALEDSRAQSIGTLRGIAGSIERNDRLLALGVDYDATMRDILGAIGGHAAVLNLVVGRESNGHRELALKAVAKGDAVEAILHVGDLERSLNKNPLMQDVRVDLPSRVEASNGKVNLEFSVRSKLGGAGV